MRAKQSSLFLLNSSPSVMRRGRPTFRTDEVVPQSGIYRVRHRKHRLPDEVSLVRDHTFPRCAKCKDSVMFELSSPVKEETEVTTEFTTRIYLYELPVWDDAEEIAA
jgi:hypothetical protein